MAILSKPSEWRFLTGNCHEFGHMWHPSCVYCCIELCLIVFKESFKVYLPLYLLSNMGRLTDFRWVLLNLLPNVLRSSLFLGVNGGGLVLFLCLTRKILGGFYFYSAALIPGFLASISAIFLERKHRRGLLAGYTSILAIEIVHSVLKSKGLIKTIPYGEVMIFSLASAVLVFRQWVSKGPPPDAVGSILNLLFRPPVQSPLKLCFPVKGMGGLLWVALWSFFIGYVFQSLFALLSYWKKIAKKTSTIKDWLSNEYSVKFGLFLASFTTWFKLANWLMKAGAVPKEFRTIISGLVAGLSMVLIRSPTISMYAGWKALEVVYFAGVKRGYTRAWYYGDALLYGFSTAVLLHSIFFEGHHSRETYLKFIERVTMGRLLQINYPVMDYFGTNASLRPTQYLKRLTEEQQSQEE